MESTHLWMAKYFAAEIELSLRILLSYISSLHCNHVLIFSKKIILDAIDITGYLLNTTKIEI